MIVTERSPKQVTVIRLQARAAKLTIRLVDVVTGRPLDRAQLVLRSEDNPKRQYTRSLTAFHKKNGEIKLLLPSLPLTIEASAPGYENWSYGDPNSKEQSATLLLVSDETREITVALRPLTKAIPADKKPKVTLVRLTHRKMTRRISARRAEIPKRIEFVKAKMTKVDNKLRSRGLTFTSLLPP